MPKIVSIYNPKLAKKALKTIIYKNIVLKMFKEISKKKYI